MIYRLLPFNKKMLAYCGLYCEQCSGKLARDEQNAKHLESIPFSWAQMDLSERSCEGCKGDYCVCKVNCNIKSCALSKEIDSCVDCNDFPCEHIEAFANDGMPHHKRAVENLNKIKQYGVEKWFNELNPSLQCGQCGERQSWYYSCDKHQK